MIAGLAVVKDPALADKLYYLQNSFGAVLGVQDAWLVLRGLKTLHVRLEHSVKGAAKLADFFQEHPLINKVYYPGLPDHPQYEIQKAQAKSAGAVLSFDFINEDVFRTFVKQCKNPCFCR